MPITFVEETGLFEGENLFGETLEGFDFSVFGGVITNTGTISAPITSASDLGIEVFNRLGAVISKTAGSSYAVQLLGNGGRNFVNDGTFIGVVAFGNGWDSFYNSGLVQGRVETGNGNDLLTNQVTSGIDGGPPTLGTITGTVYMGEGDDTVLNSGTMGNIILGNGNDSYSAGGFEIVFEGFSPLTGTSGDVRGDAGNDTIMGGNSADKFYGGIGDDLLIGNAGRDKLEGGAGNDEISGGAGNDKIAGGSGADTLDGGSNNDNISGGDDDDLIYAGSGNDNVNGNSGDDTIFGGSGNDRLVGANGNDIIDGGAGRDTMIGGAGEDSFVFRGYSGLDEIRDFSGNDLIEMYFSGPVVVTHADILVNTTFVGNHALIDLGEIFNISDFGFGNDHGSFLTVRNVTVDDLDTSAFGLYNEILVVG